MTVKLPQEKSDQQLLSAIIEQMHNKLSAMHFVLQSVITQVSKKLEEYHSITGTETYSELLKFQLSLNAQIMQLNSDIDELYNQYHQMMSQSASLKSESKDKASE